MEITFDEGFLVTGNAKLIHNWSHSNAYLHREGAMPEVIPCASFFLKFPAFAEITKPMFSFPEKAKKKAGEGSESSR
eukprot:12828154-Heterocapsa_arctica.AAC.1